MKKYDIIIALEGIDGAGKTTLANLLKKDYGEAACIYSRTKKGQFSKILLSHPPLNKCRLLQIPFYLILSYKNYLQCFKHVKANILIMDRCFLSNICYFYPFVLKNKTLFKFAMLFELNLFPHEIYIIDEDPAVAQKRDNMEKELNWLRKTRVHYLDAQKSSALLKYNISILSNELTIEEKRALIGKKIEILRG